MKIHNLSITLRPLTTFFAAIVLHGFLATPLVMGQQASESVSPVAEQGSSLPPTLVSPGSLPFTESVADMMRREAEQPAVPDDGWYWLEEAPLLIPEAPRQLGYAAPFADMPIWPESFEDAPQTVGQSFIAINLQDQFNAFGTGSIPPDTMGAVGPNHFVEFINSSVAIYNKTGTRLSHVGLTTFFTVTISGTTYPRNGSFDPRVCFDRRSGRYFATAMERGAVSGQQNGIVLAISRTNDATGVWDKYFIDAGVPAAGATTFFTDYSTLGTDDNGVYLGMTIFVSTGGSRGKIVATDKATLLAGSPSLSPVFQFDNITDVYSAIQPALNFDAVAAGARAWFVASWPFTFTGSDTANITYRTLTWSGAPGSRVAAVTATATLTTGTTIGFPINAPASGSGTNINTGDFRMQMAVIRNNSLWCARTAGTNAAGGSTAVDRTGAEWFQLNVTNATPTVTQRGLVFDAAEGVYYYYPSIVVSGQGHATIGFSGSNAGQFVGAYFTGRLSGDGAGTMGSVVQTKPGEAAYQRLDSISRNRWGDYSYTSLDPNDDMTMWTLQEYATNINPGNNIWGTWISQLLAPPPATPASASPATVSMGLPSVNVTVTGTQVSGSGFYDPGAGFPNRIAASVPTAGVVNSVTYNSPTSVTLNLNTTTATLGAKNVTVTNPDGQAQTSAAPILTVIAPLQLTAAASRKLHGGAGTFDISLPLGGGGVECRTGSPSVRFTFNNNIASVGSVVVVGASGSPSGVASISGNVVTAALSGVNDVQVLTITLNSVTDVGGGTLSPSLAMKMLQGDVNGGSSVNITDINLVRAGSSPGTVNGANFRGDVNTTGSINISDVNFVRSKSGNSLP